MSRIAVIQSVYKNDKPEYLRLSIESILKQTFQDFVLYLGIDGPIGRDLTDIIDNLEKEKIVVIYSKENKGLAYILNTLLRECVDKDYDFIARMDSDDIAYPERFEKQVAFMEKHDDVDVLGCAINEIDECGNNLGHIVNYPCSPKECRSFFSKRNPVAHPTVLFRKRFFDKIGMFYPTNYLRNEDTELWLQGFLHNSVITNLPDVLLNYRVTAEMFKQRRSGREFAKSQLTLRKKINKQLDYGVMSDVFAYAMYLLMISPIWLRKLAYKVFR